MPRLSLILPTKRGGETLNRCLDSIKKHTTDYETVIIKGNLGFGAKLNKGITQSKGEYLIFLHDDCEVQAGWTDELARLGAFKLGENNDSFDTWGGFINPPRYCTDPKEFPDYSYWLCVKRDVMGKIGLFDERFTSPFFQDVDTGLRIQRAGFKIKCLSGKIIHRNAEDSGIPDEKQRFYLERKWGVIL